MSVVYTESTESNHIIYMTIEEKAENDISPWQDGSSKVDNEIIKI